MGYFWKAREMLTPTLKHSAFLSKGLLTPEEFVRAGDELVYRCPTWSWQGGKVSYLPSDKQYLITRNVPCRDRVSALEIPQQELLDDDDGGDWMLSSMPQQKKEHDIEDEFDVIDEEGEVIAPPPKTDAAVEEDADEYADMADFEDDNVLLDDDIAAEPKEEDDNILSVRTYDLTITYDKVSHQKKFQPSTVSHT